MITMKRAKLEKCFLFVLLLSIMVATKMPHATRILASAETSGQINMGDFDESVREKIFQASPDFVSRLNRLIDEFKESHMAMWNALGGPKKVVRMYRGIHMKNIKQYQPNFGLFELDPSGHIAGGIDVTTDYNIAKTYALAHQSQSEPGYVIEFQVPVAILGAGRFDDAFIIGSWSLSTLGISDISVFQTQIKPVK